MPVYCLDSDVGDDIRDDDDDSSDSDYLPSGQELSTNSRKSSIINLL